MGSLHIYRGSGMHCPFHKGWPPELVHKTHFVLECPECGRTQLTAPTTGDMLRYSRKARKMSKAGLARKAGVSVSTITRYEENARFPTEKTLLKLVDALEVDPAPFLKKHGKEAALFKEAKEFKNYLKKLNRNS